MSRLIDVDYFLNELGSFVHDKCDKELADKIMIIVPLIANCISPTYAIPIDKVKAAKNEIIDSKVLKVGYEYYYSSEDVIKILNKLITESEKV